MFTINVLPDYLLADGAVRTHRHCATRLRSFGVHGIVCVSMCAQTQTRIYMCMYVCVYAEALINSFNHL